jgi:exopolyphosphatase/guanosine-5'-triphosphate,3'-diphosphate pyrophosphatase
MPRYAAIDIGSNSARMLTAEMGRGSEMVTLASHREVTRLGAGVFRSGVITKDSIELVCGVLTRFAKMISPHDVLAVRAVATAAVRDASNQREFLDRASEAAGVPIEIISGQEEARLAHLGVQTLWPHERERLMIVDIGGGSAEIIVSEKGQFREAFSKPLGAVRLTGMFLRSDPAKPSQLAALEEFIEERLAPAVKRFRGLRFDRVIATSSTAAAVVCAANRIPRSRRDEADRLRAKASQVTKLYRDLSEKNLEKRRKKTGIGPRRAEIIVPGIAVLRHVLEAFRQPALYYSSAGVREGIVTDLMRRRVGAELARLSTEQRQAVEALSQRFGVNSVHSRKIAGMAHQLFIEIQPVHQLPPAAGKLLEAAAHLCDSGHYVSDTGHHKHSEYIVSNADLPAFTPSERRMVANLCRFHRKSMPGAQHANFQSLPPDEQKTTLRLIPLLRLADALDQGKEQRVESLECRIGEEDVTLHLRSRRPIDLEYWAGERVAEIFEQVYERKLKIAPSRR